jgi:hypothetical protein
MVKTWKPTVGGVLCIVAGAFGIIDGFRAMHAGFLFGRGWHWSGEILGIPAIIFGIVAVIGGSFALKRQVWLLALVGFVIKRLLEENNVDKLPG